MPRAELTVTERSNRGPRELNPGYVRRSKRANVQPVLVGAEESSVLLAMILMYAIPVVIVVASLFVTSHNRRRKILYLSATLVAFIVVLVIAWTAGRDAWGFWLFFVLPAALVTGIRLIVATVLASSDAADDLPQSCSSGCNTKPSKGVQDGPRTPFDLR
ncbi:hypothetical protein [Nonomuraea sp. JJY05]|uniref:hypothetical protein n=1 Tax=Nonomuraea sp. JJY05 TaxID=3350255 RepID=UPI00373E6300